METVTQTIRINGKTITLITDGRTLTKEFDTLEEASQVYDYYKNMIDKNS